MTKRPLTQPFNWVGSKVRMRGRLLDIFKEIPRSLYVEPFGGSGAVFFGKTPEPSVYNDKNGLLVNFFRKLRSKKDRNLIKTLARYTPSNSEYWHEFKELCKAYEQKNEQLIQDALVKTNLVEYDVETAVAFAFYYCQRNAFGGSYLHAYGEECKQGGAYFNSIELLDAYSERLALTTITKRDFRECIQKSDAPTTFFYCDPPYESKTSVDYKAGWTTDDTKSLVRLLLDVKASVVLSCYDADVYRPLLDVGYVKQDFDSYTSFRRGLYSDSDGKRTETVYVKNNAAKTARLF